MDARKRQRPEKKGWKSGTVQELLELTDDENTLGEIRARLALAVLELRSLGHLTQAQVAKRAGSSQSRVAKMEAKDPSVSFDLLIRTLTKFGVSMQTVGAILAERREGQVPNTSGEMPLAFGVRPGRDTAAAGPERSEGQAEPSGPSSCGERSTGVAVRAAPRGFARSRSRQARDSA